MPQHFPLDISLTPKEFIFLKDSAKWDVINYISKNQSLLYYDFID